MRRTAPRRAQGSTRTQRRGHKHGRRDGAWSGSIPAPGASRPEEPSAQPGRGTCRMLGGLVARQRRQPPLGTGGAEARPSAGVPRPWGAPGRRPVVNRPVRLARCVLRARSVVRVDRRARASAPTRSRRGLGGRQVSGGGPVGATCAAARHSCGPHRRCPLGSRRSRSDSSVPALGRRSLRGPPPKTAAPAGQLPR